MPEQTVGVVVPCHNYGRYFAEALASLDRQSRRPDEIVVIDDGSTDDSWPRIREALEGRPDVRCHRRSPARGAVATFNDGVALCGADLVVVLSADDRLSPDYLGRLEEAIVGHGWDFAYTDLHCFGAEDRIVAVPDLDLALLGRENYVSGSAMFRRELFERCGGFDPAFERLRMEDWELWLRAVSGGARGGRVAGCWVEWRRHAEGSRNSLGPLGWARLRWGLWRRYPGLVPRPRPLSFLGNLLGGRLPSLS